jgi:hypothetical protein
MACSERFVFVHLFNFFLSRMVVFVETMSIVYRIDLKTLQFKTIYMLIVL